jgi:hypothetical protein
MRLVMSTCVAVHEAHIPSYATFASVVAPHKQQAMLPACCPAIRRFGAGSGSRWKRPVPCRPNESLCIVYCLVLVLDLIHVNKWCKLPSAVCAHTASKRSH